MGSSVAGAGSLWGLGGGREPVSRPLQHLGGWRVFGCITLMVASSICLFVLSPDYRGPVMASPGPRSSRTIPHLRTSLPRLQGPSGRVRSHGRRSGRSGRGQRWGSVTLRPMPWKDADRPGCEPTRWRRALTAELSPRRCAERALGHGDPGGQGAGWRLWQNCCGRSWAWGLALFFPSPPTSGNPLFWKSDLGLTVVSHLPEVNQAHDVPDLVLL